MQSRRSPTPPLLARHGPAPEPTSRRPTPVTLKPRHRPNWSLRNCLPRRTGGVLNEFLRKTKATWAPVPDAATYKVEVEYQDADSQWHPNSLAAESKSTEREFEFVGAQPGRWRVCAVDASGQEGPKSEWRTFRYSQ